MEFKYKFQITIFLTITIFMISFVYAVPAAPSSICEITANVLDVAKKQAVIGSFVPSPNGENIINYYDINIDIIGISTYKEERNIYCDENYTKNVESHDYPVILHEDKYNLTPILVGQRIKARIDFGGDEFFHGYFLSNVNIINNDSITKTEGNITCKDSCPLEGKCYPFGYRKSNKFCSDTGSFVEQVKGDEVCENNFECSSNVCVSGKCIEEGLIIRILNWFKRLFS